MLLESTRAGWTAQFVNVGTLSSWTSTLRTCIMKSREIGTGKATQTATLKALKELRRTNPQPATVSKMDLDLISSSSDNDDQEGSWVREKR